MEYDKEIYSCAQLVELIQEIGFLPLLDSGIRGYSAEEMVTEDCRYVVFSDGGWDWPLWKWKGPAVTEGGCVYGNQTSITTVAACIQHPRKGLSKRQYC